MLKTLSFILNIILLAACIFMYIIIKDNASLIDHLNEKTFLNSKESIEIKKEIKRLKNKSFNARNSNREIQSNDNLRIELLSLISVTVRYFSNIAKEHENLIKILESINQFNELPEEEKANYQKTLEENLTKLREENQELIKLREGLNQTIENLNNNSFE